MEVRAEIVVNGLVQGVGYRYFVIRQAQILGLKGYTQNLYTGEVLTVVEGEKAIIEELIKKLKVGPIHASVKSCKVDWQETKNEFTDFEVKF
ncbi:MAG: acylphosphatase [Ignavibacteriota bacterium]|jgi:acylphosphatase|nr:MAG: acylphosphatase [Chlorobiota bacterium]MBE7476822.1 acylphosphatase [Ignavibacteriales bacterium]MBL1121926.1 acylphosphatase [Ignavibacteriota bacterium]MCC7092931.1 acylphosphatase [Ignavibacteriaceae bacterium]MCE7855585.1 acylphosphatase [Ignavibacteria bacterium CHB3]MEB2296000.1 acylphosphatase [Ignavibacteria bacterium]